MIEIEEVNWSLATGRGIATSLTYVSLSNSTYFAQWIYSNTYYLHLYLSNVIQHNSYIQ